MTVHQHSSLSLSTMPSMLSTTWKKATFYTSEKRSRLFSGRPLRTYITAAFLFLFCFSVFHIRGRLLPPSPVPAAPEPEPEPEPEPDPHPELILQPDAPRCGGELDVLKDKELGISARIKYSRRCIKPVFTNAWYRDDVHNITESLIPRQDKFREVELDKCIPEQYQGLTQCDQTIRMEVPQRYPERTYPEFVFAIATNFQRLQFFRPAFKQWMSDSGAQLVATVLDPEDKRTSDEDLRAEELRWQKDGIRMKCIRQRNPEDTVTQVHMVMIQDAMDLATDETQWIGILDDDTFFPHFYPLWRALHAFDASKPYYVGAPSEQLSTINNYGMNAFGGAGVFLSIPLARKIAPVARECLGEKTHGGRIPMEGDTLMAECVYHHTTTKLTWLRGLWQLDIHGNPDGFFESGRPMISLHHWKKGSGWAAAPVLAMSKIASLCGDCFLSRWRTGTKEVFTAGYSIARYPEGNDKLDLDKMESTFKMDWDYGFSLGPFREKMEGKDKKKSYKIVWSKAIAEGGLRETYVFSGDTRKGEIDEVVELVWEGKKG